MEMEMSDQTSVSTPEPRRRSRFRSALFMMAIILAAGFTGAFANQAISQGFRSGYGYWHGGGFMGGSLDPAFIEDRADRMVRHLAIEIDASFEQQDKLRALTKATIRDLLPMREKAWFARREMRVLLTQPAVDRAAIEKFRTEQLALADAFTKRVAQALADTAEILTPEQRRQLDERLTQFQEFSRSWHRG
jgi:protein CpxP